LISYTTVSGYDFVYGFSITYRKPDLGPKRKEDLVKCCNGNAD